MLINILFILFLICFGFLAYKNFQLAISLFVILLPVYLIRTSFGFFPTTLLEFAFIGILSVWLIKYASKDWPILVNFIQQNKAISIGAILLIIGAFIASLGNPYLLRALGIWRAYFVEPIILFFIIIASKQRLGYQKIFIALLYSTLSISLLTIIQKTTNLLLPPSLWNAELFGRPTAFFTSPNAIGLFMVPIFVSTLFLYTKPNLKNIHYYLIGLLSLIAILLSYSQGAWIALSGGIVIFLFLINYKKLVIGLMTCSLIAILISGELQQAILFQDKAGQNRLDLWRYSVEYLTANPKHFILGAGLRRFYNEVQKPNYNPKEVEPLVYPHNIVLNFWLETGLLGLVAMIIIFFNLFYRSIINFSNNQYLKASIIAGLSALIIHGLVDVPYFKNDLSMMFWLLAGAIILSLEKSKIPSN